MRGRLVIFCGIPGSGKTTIAKVVADEMPKSILIQTDAVRAMLARPDFSSPESKFVYDGCFAVAKEALRNGYTVLLDGTFMREDYRSDARERLGRFAARVDTVYVVCGLRAALRRNSLRRATIPPGKLKSIHDRFEEPKKAIRVDTARFRPEEAGARIVAELA